MREINKKPVSADFGNAEENGAIRLVTRGTLSDLERMQINLVEGQRIWLTDNDVEMIGIVARRDDIWVAIPDENGFKNVPREAWYHIDNLLDN